MSLGAGPGQAGPAPERPGPKRPVPGRPAPERPAPGRPAEAEAETETGGEDWRDWEPYYYSADVSVPDDGDDWDDDFAGRPAGASVERFDIEPFSDFSAK